MSEKKKKQRVLTFGSGLIYGFGILGVQLLIGMMNSYQSQFYTSVFGAELTKCAVIILVSKLISCFADPIIGSVIDRTRFKSGNKMKPWVGISLVPLAVLTAVMFVDIKFPNDTLMYCYITVTTVIWNVAMSFADIPSQGLLALLSPDSDEKSMAAGISNTLRSVGLAAPTVIVPIICLATKSRVITSKEYLISVGVMSLIGISLASLMLWRTKEVIPSVAQANTMREMFTELRRNKNLRMVFLLLMFGFARNMAMNIQIQASAVLVRDVTMDIGGFHLDLAGENLSVILGMGSAISSTIAIVTAPMINAKLGTKKTYYLFALYGFLVSAICFALFVFGGVLFRTTPSLVAMTFAFGFMFGTHGFTPMVMIADTVDYTQMTTGRRNEGVQYAVLSFGVKMANAICVAMGIFIVGLSGYKGTMTYNDITPKMQNIVFSAYVLIPGISTLLSCIPLIFYNIDGKVKKQVKEFMKSVLEERESGAPKEELTAAEKAD